MKQSIRFSIKTSIPDITNSTLGGDVLEAKQQELFFSELRGIRDKVSQLSIFANGNNDSSNEKLIDQLKDRQKEALLKWREKKNKAS